jgi:hypothetical protein
VIQSPAFDEFARRYDEAVRAAMLAAAYVYASAVKARLMQGYTTGNFSHGGAGVAGTVTVGEVVRAGDRWTVPTGTNVPYALYWEYGHFNLFTRQYERVEVWRETFEARATDMVSAFGATFVSRMHGVAAPMLQLYQAESPYLGPDPAPGFGGYRG